MRVAQRTRSQHRPSRFSLDESELPYRESELPPVPATPVGSRSPERASRQDPTLAVGRCGKAAWADALDSATTLVRRLVRPQVPCRDGPGCCLMRLFRAVSYCLLRVGGRQETCLPPVSPGRIAAAHEGQSSQAHRASCVLKAWQASCRPHGSLGHLTPPSLFGQLLPRERWTRITRTRPSHCGCDENRAIGQFSLLRLDGR